MKRSPFKEYDCFRLAKPLPSETIPVGTIGTILMVFPDSVIHYEVEFSDGEGGNLGTMPTFTISEEFMSPLDATVSPDEVN